MNKIRDADLFVNMLVQHKGIIYKVANAYCKDAEHRKDLVQEIMLQLWLAFPNYDAQYKVSTWMYRIALNVSISFYRKTSRRAAIQQPLPEGILEIRETTTPEDPRLSKLQACIKALKSIDRAIILLYLEGHSQQEIADLLGLTLSNVGTKFSRIKQKIKEKIS